MLTKPTTLSQALIWGKHQLKNSRTAGLDARVLLEFVTKLNRADMMNRSDKLLTSSSFAKYQRLIAKRVTGMPVAYLTGRKEFMDFEVAVNRHVLIPRPATEAIVNTAVRLAKQFKVTQIHEIGTGSGVIAIALARQLPNIKVIASDISQSALAVAKTNIDNYRLARKIRLIKGSLANHVKKATLVVANLPYLPTGLKVAPELKFEPKSALFVAGDGLELYRKLFSTPKFDVAVVELGSRQYPKLAKWLTQKFPQSKVEPVYDIDKTICGLQVIF